MKLRSLVVFAGIIYSSVVYSASYPLPEDGSQMVGKLQNHVIKKGETLAGVAKKYDVGFLSLMAANKGVDPFLPYEGTILTIPSQFILPTEDREGIVINLAELRLYYYDKEKPIVHVFPVGIGRIGRDTPVMTTRVVEKIVHPTWTPTENIRKEYTENGIELPEVVPAGPENPLGDYAMRLAFGSGEFLIHGTNKEFGIGLRVSSGCIRMEPPHIEWLFSQAVKGEKVRVVNIPVKVTLEPDRSVFIEVHEPLTDSNGNKESLEIPMELRWWMDEFGYPMTKARAAILIQSGIPTEVVGAGG